MARNKKLKIDIQLLVYDKKMTTDESKITQMLISLIENSIKYAKS